MQKFVIPIFIFILAFAWSNTSFAQDDAKAAKSEEVKERKAAEERQQTVKSRQQELLQRRSKLVRNYRDRVERKPGTSYSYTGREGRTTRTHGRLSGEEARQAYDEELVKTDVKRKSDRKIRSMYMPNDDPDSERFRNEYRKELQNYNMAAYQDSSAASSRGAGRKYLSTDGVIYAQRFARPQLAGHVSGYSGYSSGRYGVSGYSRGGGGSITVGVDLSITTGRGFSSNGVTQLSSTDISISVN